MTNSTDAIQHRTLSQKEMIEHELSQIRRYAKVLDSHIKLPGGISVGLDSIIGIIPGIGDIATGSLSMWIVVKARKLGVGKFALFKMIANVCIDTLLGMIPLLGDLFDLVYKSNLRNLRLIEKHLEKELVRLAD